mgnify:CR=1 FL=1
MKTIDIVRKYKAEGYHVTAYDNGDHRPELVFAIKLRTPIDLYYMGNLGLGAPVWDEVNSIIYFPEVRLDKESYGAMINDPS